MIYIIKYIIFNSSDTLGVNIVGEYCKQLSDLRVTDCRDVSEQSLGKLRRRGVK